MDRTRLACCAAAAAHALFLFAGGCNSGNSPSAPRITGPAPSLPDGTVDEAYSVTFTATGTAPIAWAVVEGAAPDGLSLDAGSGELSGTPSAEADATFTIRARNAQGDATQQFTLTVEAAPLPGTPPTITTITLPDGTASLAYEQTLAASGTIPITWSLASGTLPTGLALGESTGVLAGTPVASGQASFTVQATNGAGTDTQALSVTILEAPTAPSIQGPASPLPDAVEDSAYSQTFTATGTTPITWSVSQGSLPQGLQLDPDTGELAGTPTVSGANSFTVTATNTVDSDHQACELTVAQPPSLSTLTPDEAPVGTTIVIDGNGFDTTPANNAVTFGGESATVLSATANELTVEIPTGITGTVAVRVTVDALASNLLNFTVDPATVWFVDVDATGNDDGTSWSDAFTDLQDAIAASDDNDQIWIAEGTYVPGTESTDWYTLHSGLEIYGGFDGTEGRRLDRDPVAHPTTLSAEVDGDPNSTAGNSYHILVCEGSNVASGVRLTNGTGIGTAEDETGKGAGILIRGPDVVVRNVLVSDCTTGYGGGLCALTGPITVEDCAFVGNRANDGGGIYLTGSPTTPNRITRCVFDGGAGGAGVGAFDDSPATTWSDCVFLRCYAPIGGGGLMLQGDGHTTVQGCTFFQCTTTLNGFRGAAICMRGDIDSATLRDCVLWGNSTMFLETGAVEVLAGTLEVTTCVLQRGYADEITGTKTDGGGNTDADPLFENIADLIGPDGRWGTRDDGLMPGAGGSAIDAGTSAGASSSDVTGTARPQGAGIDIGAYERGD